MAEVVGAEAARRAVDARAAMAEARGAAEGARRAVAGAACTPASGLALRGGRGRGPGRLGGQVSVLPGVVRLVVAQVLRAGQPLAR